MMGFEPGERRDGLVIPALDATRGTMAGKHSDDPYCDGGAWPRLGDRLWRLVWRIREWVSRHARTRR